MSSSDLIGSAVCKVVQGYDLSSSQSKADEFFLDTVCSEHTTSSLNSSQMMLAYDTDPSQGYVIVAFLPHDHQEAELDFGGGIDHLEGSKPVDYALFEVWPGAAESEPGNQSDGCNGKDYSKKGISLSQTVADVTREKFKKDTCQVLAQSMTTELVAWGDNQYGCLVSHLR